MIMEDDYVFVEPEPQPPAPPPLPKTHDFIHKALPPSPPDTPPHSPSAQARELTWLLDSLQTTLLSLKHGLEECYALIAPIEAGSTLVLSTPRAELVKGHVARVGARLLKGTIHTKLRTTAPVTLSINPAHPIHLAPLVTLNTLLTEADNLASLCLSEGTRKSQTDDSAAAVFLSSQLRLLAQHIDEASAILKGPPANPSNQNNGDKSTQSPSAATSASRPGTATTTDTNTALTTTTTNIVGSDWTQWSAASNSFTPPLSRALSFHVTIQDACLVLYLRALEPADAPVNLGIKLALAIGTARRLEHDEAEKIFTYKHNEVDPSFMPPTTGKTGSSQGQGESAYPMRGIRNLAGAGAGIGDQGGDSSEIEKVYVREKVRVESADPSLLSMSTKLTALSNTLSLARRNLAAVMGVEFEE